MSQTPSDILALSGEAAILVQKGRIAYANAGARSLLGADCQGRPARALLGSELTEAQSPAFLAEAAVKGVPCLVRYSRSEAGQILFFTRRSSEPEVLSDAFLFQLRNALSNQGMANDCIRSAAEHLGSEEILRQTRIMARSHHRLTRQVSNASILLGLRNGTLPRSFCLFNLSALCRELLQTLRMLKPDFYVTAELGDELSMEGDPSLLLALLTNLLSNCAIHAEGCTQVRLSLTETPGGLLLSVSDDGRGIAPEALYTVFDRYRYPFSLGELDRGAGLGMSVACAVTRLHGGVLLLESRPDSGTSVRVSLSRRARGGLKLSAVDSVPLVTTRDLLIGFADVLGEDCYDRANLD